MWCVTLQVTLIRQSSLNAGASRFHMMSQRYKHAESIASFHGPIPATPEVAVCDHTQTISVLHEIEAMAADVGIVMRVRGCNNTCTRIAKDIGVCVDGLDDRWRHCDAAHG